jgi:ubiquinone biosynthesis protein
MSRVSPRLPTFVLDLQRLLLVLSKCVKYGLFPYAHLVPWVPHRADDFPVRVRLLLEELRLTYLKLGQFLATRYDILPPEVCRELAKLFEEIPPMPFADTKDAIESELGAPLATLFDDFHEEAVAAGSVAQVHLARVRGMAVAVKAQRPGLERIFHADIRNLRRFAGLVDSAGLFGRLSAKGMVGEFARWTLKELDFRQEGHSADRLRATAQPFEVVPRILWELTTARILSAAEVADILAREGIAGVRRQLPGFDVEQGLHKVTVASLSHCSSSGFFTAIRILETFCFFPTTGWRSSTSGFSVR